MTGTRQSTQANGQDLKGVFAANLTPQNKDLSVDRNRLVAHCKWLLANGCSGIAPLGTTGEANSLTVTERMELIDSLVHGGISPERMILGTGCCAFPDTVTLTKHAMGYGVPGVLILPPFYYKGVGDEGLFRFFDRIIQKVGDSRLRIYLYHFPQMTGVPIRVPLVERLLEAYPSTISGMKDSSGDWRHMASLCQDLPGFRMYAGTERFLLDILEIGGAGCISATANVTCTLARQVYQAWSSNDNAREIQDRLSGIRSIIEKHPMIPALKFLMAHLTGDTDWHFVRPPHIPMPEGDRKKLLAALEPVSFLETLNGIL